MAKNLNAFSDSDVDVLRRIVARERANYPANVRSLAPVRRAKIDWKSSTTPKVAWLSNLRTAFTYTSGSEKELQFSSTANASDGTMTPKETVASSGFYTQIELTEPGVYQAESHASFDSSGWVYSTAADALGDAFDQVSLRIQVRDKNLDEISTGLPRQWTTVLAYYKFCLSSGGMVNLAGVSASLFPLTVRALIYSDYRDFVANSSSGSFFVQKVRASMDG